MSPPVLFPAFQTAVDLFADPLGELGGRVNLFKVQ